MLSFFRIIKFSFQDIVRNIWLSIVTITILILALFSMNMLFTVKLVSQNAVTAVKNKINISLYFKADANISENCVKKSDIDSLGGRYNKMTWN